MSLLSRGAWIEKTVHCFSYWESGIVYPVKAGRLSCRAFFAPSPGLAVPPSRRAVLISGVQRGSAAPIFCAAVVQLRQYARLWGHAGNAGSNPAGGTTKTYERMMNNARKKEFCYKQQYAVIVVCSDEADQEKVYNRLKEEGYKLKVVAV